MKFLFAVGLSIILLCGCANSTRFAENPEEKLKYESSLPGEQSSEGMTPSESKQNSHAMSGSLEKPKTCTKDELTAMRLAALQKKYPPDSKFVVSNENYNEIFTPAKLYEDKTTWELSKFLYNAQIGSEVADINFSDNANFESIDKIDKVVLLSCCLNNSIDFTWKSRNKDNPFYLDGYECFTEYTGEIDGYFKEDVERQAQFYFGENVIVDHFALTEISGWRYFKDAGVHTAPSVGGGGTGKPFVLSYTQNGDLFEVIFTSMVHLWGVEDGYVTPNLALDPVEEWMTPEEAVEWYRDHGAKAKVILRKHEDGRYTIESFEKLCEYDKNAISEK